MRITRGMVFFSLGLSVLLGIGVFFSMARANPLLSKRKLTSDENTPWKITAKRLSYDEKANVYHAKGDVLIVRGDQSLSAQEAVYNRQTGIAEVSGNVRLKSGGDILTGETGTFNLKEQTGRIEKGCLFLKQNHYYLRGGTMEKIGENTYVIKKCRLTTCDGENPAWSITGSEVKITVEGYGVVKHAAFRVKDWPLFYVPYMIFPAKTKRQTGLLPPRIGHSNRNGVDVEVPFFWAISDQTDATLYERYMSQRGYMQGLEFRYAGEKESKGNFLLDFLRDRKETKDMTDPDELEISPFTRTNESRYWFRGGADQEMPFGVTARLDADLVSDQDYLREFQSGLAGYDARPDLAEVFGRPVDERYAPTRRSALRLSREWQDTSLQALSSYHQRPEDPSNDMTPQPLGSVKAMMAPTSLHNLPVYFGLDSDYSYVWREEGAAGNQLSLSPDLRFPRKLLNGYLEVVPSFRYTLDSYKLNEDGQGLDDSALKGAYEAACRISTDLERVYDTGWKTATRLKHRIWPVLTYRYRVPHGDTEERPWFDPFDQEGRVNQITLALENYLDARLEDKKGNAHYRQWGTFTLSQGYDIDEATREALPGGRKEPLTPLTADLLVTPYSYVDVRGNAQWNHYDRDFDAGRLSLDFKIPRSGDRRDHYSLDFLYAKGTTKSLGFDWNVNLPYGFSTGMGFHRNLLVDTNIYSYYWVGYRRQCWGIQVSLAREDRDTRFMIGFNLLGLGDIGTYAREGNWSGR
jgi:LPS-assembly protein